MRQGTEIINGYLLKVLKPKLSNQAHVYIFNFFFMSQLLSTGIDGRKKPSFSYSNVKNWDRRLRSPEKILNKKIILVPINHENNHWLFLCAKPKEYLIQLRDPQGMKLENKIYMYAMQCYLEQKMIELGHHPSEGLWTLSDESESSPRQYNDSDCGLFLIVNMTLLSQEFTLNSGSYTEQCLRNQRTRERVAYLLWEKSSNKPQPYDSRSSRQMTTRRWLRSAASSSSTQTLQIASVPTSNIDISSATSPTSASALLPTSNMDIDEATQTLQSASVPTSR
jgi:hypothetical protein